MAWMNSPVLSGMSVLKSAKPAASSVSTHSQDSSGDGVPTLTSKIPSHRRRPVPMAQMDPGLRREDEEGDAAVNRLNAPEH
jgi:hypothetical protein